MKNEFRTIGPKMWAKGSSYGPLLTDGYNYLCPECGGYGYLPTEKKCSFCNGEKVIPLDDKRVTAFPKFGTAPGKVN
jgi:hypothetical protein